MAVPGGSTPFPSIRKAESLSSLPLQVAVHLNICLAPFLFIAEICCLILKTGGEETEEKGKPVKLGETKVHFL
ncbi:hypothetical protein OSTOST_25196 [Ostertagia ostertagi]